MRTGSKISPFGDNNSLYYNSDMSKTIAETAQNRRNENNIILKTEDFREKN